MRTLYTTTISNPLHQSLVEWNGASLTGLIGNARILPPYECERGQTVYGFRTRRDRDAFSRWAWGATAAEHLMPRGYAPTIWDGIRG